MFTKRQLINSARPISQVSLLNCEIREGTPLVLSAIYDTVVSPETKIRIIKFCYDPIVRVFRAAVLRLSGALRQRLIRIKRAAVGPQSPQGFARELHVGLDRSVFHF